MPRRPRLVVCVLGALGAALALVGCGSSASPAPTATLPAVAVSSQTVAVSPSPALRAVDADCATVVPPLRPTIADAYSLDPESLTPAALATTSASYAGAARRLRALALTIPRDDPTLRALRPIVRTFAGAERVLARSVAHYAVEGSAANVLGAQIAIESDVATLTGFARANGLPHCAAS